MAWNYKKNTWDEIIKRIEELESFELPFNLIHVSKSEGYGKNNNWSFVEYPSNKKAFFRFELSKPYSSIDIILVDSGHWWNTKDQSIFNCIIDNSEKEWEQSNGKVFKTRKEAVCWLLNRWEYYIKNKKWEKTYDEFRKRVKKLCQK